MTYLSDADRRRLLDRVVDLIDAIPDQCCLECRHFNEHQGEVCELAGGRPPARVIIKGCPAFKQQIPF